MYVKEFLVSVLDQMIFETILLELKYILIWLYLETRSLMG